MSTNILSTFKRLVLFFLSFVASFFVLVIIGNLLGFAVETHPLSSVWGILCFVLPIPCGFIALKFFGNNPAAKLDAQQINSTTPSISTASRKEKTESATTEILETSHQNLNKRSFERTEDLPVTTAAVLKTYKVTGMQHYMDSIMELAVENYDYDLTKKDLIDRDMIDYRMWKYEFPSTNASLVPEPTNPHDKNAIKVLVNGVHVGYIKAGSCAHLLKVIREDRIKSISCKMGGGPYKEVSLVYDEEKEKDIYEFEKGNCNYFVHLDIAEKTK